MKTAWYIDDDQEMIQAISMMLQLLDYTVRPFHNAQAASREFASGQHPDLLILDINMPQVTGMDMLEFVRRQPHLNSLPVLMLSSEDTDVQIQAALEMGADAYALKPVTLDELEQAIQKAISARPAG